MSDENADIRKKLLITVAAAGSEKFEPVVWRRVSVKKSLDEICHSVELELPISQKNRIHKHDTIEIRYQSPYITHNNNNLRVTTVRVDDVTDTTDQTGKFLTVLARSPARDIIDSTWSGTISSGTSLLKVAQQIGKVFGIEAIHLPSKPAGRDDTEAITSFTWENESPWTKLLNEADNQGYVITSNEAGNLYVTKSGRDAEYWKFALLEGINVKSVQLTESGAEQFNRYIVRAARYTGEAIDSTCRNKRVLTVNLSDYQLDQEKVRRRAQIEMYRRRKVTATVTVHGWGLSDTQLKFLGDTTEKELFFNPNFLIPTYLPSIGINRKLMVAEVEQEASEKTFQSTISLVNPEVYLGKEGEKMTKETVTKEDNLDVIARRHSLGKYGTTR